MLRPRADLPVSYASCDGWVRRGRVTGLSNSSVRVRLPGARPADIISIASPQGAVLAEARVVAAGEVLCSPLFAVRDVVVGAPATSVRARSSAYVGPSLLGQAVDAWGRGPSAACALVHDRAADHAQLHESRAIENVWSTGVPAIDAFCALGLGQRVGLFSGAGVGKSTLLRCIAERSGCEAQVIALVGERAREAAELIAWLRRSPRWPVTTVVCATAAAPPMERLAAARTAIAQAEWLRDLGCDVLLAIDSLTRVANAWREIALEGGEPPAHRGHPASMTGVLAGIVERAGVTKRGSISGIFAVLVDGDDPFEPVSDAVRGLLDGHIMLSRALAEAGCFPPVDVLRSVSRIMPRVVSPEHVLDAALLRRALASLEKAEDLFAIGAYQRGGDAWLDACVGVRERMQAWLFQDASVAAPLAPLHELAAELRRATGPPPDQA